MRTHDWITETQTEMVHTEIQNIALGYHTTNTFGVNHKARQRHQNNHQRIPEFYYDVQSHTIQVHHQDHLRHVTQTISQCHTDPREKANDQDWDQEEPTTCNGDRTHRTITINDDTTMVNHGHQERT